MTAWMIDPLMSAAEIDGVLAIEERRSRTPGRV